MIVTTRKKSRGLEKFVNPNKIDNLLFQITFAFKKAKATAEAVARTRQTEVGRGVNYYYKYF